MFGTFQPRGTHKPTVKPAAGMRAFAVATAAERRHQIPAEGCESVEVPDL